MEKLKVAKVEDVLLQRGQKCTSGTLHLTQHHLIFVKATTSSSKSQEEWIPYSMIWLASRLPSVIPLDQSGKPNRAAGKRIFPIALHLRNFELITIGFDADGKATDVFDSMKAVIVADAPHSLYAFYHTPSPPLKSAPAGWRVYDFKAEFARQGIATRTKAWRFCDVNAGYGFCYTYPAMMCVPSRISDSTIRYASKFRSKERIPALTYLHRGSLASITRSSQPMVGLNNRSMQDEKLIEAIFSSHLFADPLKRGKAMAIYGATTTNLIIDARPTTNAMANRAKGAGTENMDNYRGCKKVYLGIDNIHVMRDSLQRVTEALRAAQAPATFGMQARRSSVLTAKDSPPLDHLALKRSAWLKHISALMEGTLIITRNVHINNSHVLIHCSDGWDRTSQLAALAQVCLDPYFRTMKGFAVLIEKDWVSFGHRFWDRCGHASSEKYFTLAEAAANAFWGFTKQLRANFQGGGDGNSKRGAHLKEISPVFHQFLDCVWQIMRQYPKRFEFNEQWLLDLYDNVFRCQYGNFLFNCESERNGYSDGQSSSAPASSRTYSVWDEMLDEENKPKYLNSRFEPALDDEVADRSQADLGVLLPNSKDVGFWGGLFRRDSKDIN
ncbi:phosphatases II, partial [Meira miltonrushii]